MKQLGVRPSRVAEAFERRLKAKLEEEARVQGRRDLLREDYKHRLEKRGPWRLERQ
ncbi:MAG: hypothetical protein HY296_00515 [Thaumarchaeota archaeon]|nr:hypothetical protein [Nitrososphaerota archaeon]